MKNLEKQQVFVNNEYEYDYQLTINDDGNEIHTLTYADVDSWDNSVKNTVAMEIEDHGNGLCIVTKINQGNLLYTEADHLLIVLKIINSDPGLRNVHEIGTKRIL
jgi:hypothetical protein